jgi:DNA-formamidopyrimidine glycosylase
MPEGPEVKLTVDHINKYVKNFKIKDIEIIGGRYIRHKAPNNYLKFRNLLKDKPFTIKSVFSKGKGIFFELKNKNKKYFIYNTLGMSGGWSGKKNKYSTILFTLKNTKTKKSKNLYFWDIRNFGIIRFYDNKEDFDKKINSIGPDMLNDTTTFEIFEERLKLQKLQKKTIVEILMNQKIISGVGNYIKCEALYLSKLSPHRTIKSLNQNELKLLFFNIKVVIIKSYEMQGNSIRTYSNFNNDRGNYQDLLKVYMKKKDPSGCAVIRERTKDKRSTFWVPEIQK